MSTSGWYAHIRYSAEGMPVHIQYKNGSNKADEYYYMFNAQGDVVGLLDGTGKLVVEYTYDAWGQPLTITGSMKDTLGKANPLRYRCYVYDEETGMYYLGSRYYNPVMGRFISADTAEVITINFQSFTQYNLFVYCFNNPVNMSDEEGSWPSWATKIVGAVAVVATVAAVAAVTVATAGAGTVAAVVADGATKGAAIGMVSGATIGAAAGAVKHRVSTGSWSGAGSAALNGAGNGALTGAITGAFSGAASAGLKYGTFSSKSTLTNHFEKHGAEFGGMYKNTREYARGAKYVIKNGTYIPEKNAYVRFLGSQGKANYAFVGMKAGGRVSTYHVRSVSKMIKDGISLFS